MSRKDDVSRSRRRFLGSVVIGGTAVAGAAVAGVRVAPTPEAPAEKTAAGAEGKAGYHETAHIRRYYDLARV